MAAPIASQVLGEVLPYLEIKKDNEAEEEKQEIEVPNIIGMSISEAKKVLKELQLELEIKENAEEEQSDNEERKITQQLPKAGIKIKQGTSVIVYQK